MKRVLQIMDSLDMGGIQTFIMCVYRNIDKSKVQFDFLVFRSHHQVFEDEIKKLGGKIYKIPGRREGVLKHKKAMRLFFDEHPEYKMIHYHTSSLSDIDILSVGKKKNIPIRIIHSHNTKSSGSKIHIFMHKLHKRKIKDIATHYFACGKEAAEWMFGETSAINDVAIVNNGIDSNTYKFNESIRNKMRNEFKIGNDITVYGNVGRFSPVKNHTFIIKIFNEIHKIDPDTMLMLVGDGDTRQEIESMVKKLGISDSVVFLGVRQDISNILQAMDVFLLPSIYEGFPVSIIEAQSSGLTCFISDSVTKDSLLHPNAFMLSLSENAEYWASEILKAKPYNRYEDISDIQTSGFDICTTINILNKIYLKG